METTEIVFCKIKKYNVVAEKRNGGHLHEKTAENFTLTGTIQKTFNRVKISKVINPGISMSRQKPR